MGQVHGAWIWYELLTTDAGAAKAFYESVLDWAIAPGDQPPLNYGHIARADGREIGGVLPLSDEMIAQGARPCWLGYIAVDDLDTTLATVIAQGGALLMPRMDIDEGSFALVADPHGAPFYLMQPTPRAGSGPSVAFGEGLGSCAWNELAAGDVNSALPFYRSIFSWGEDEPHNMGDFGLYHLLTREGGQIGGAMTKMPQDPTPHWNYYFRVASIKTAAATVTAQGGQLVMGPMQVPGGMWILVGIDPQGAFFALLAENGD